MLKDNQDLLGVLKILDALKWIFRGRESSCVIALNLYEILAKIDPKLRQVQEIQHSLIELGEVLIEFGIRKSVDMTSDGGGGTQGLALNRTTSLVDEHSMTNIIGQTLIFLTDYGLGVLLAMAGQTPVGESAKANPSKKFISRQQVFNAKKSQRLTFLKQNLNYLKTIANATMFQLDKDTMTSSTMNAYLGNQTENPELKHETRTDSGFWDKYKLMTYSPTQLREVERTSESAINGSSSYWKSKGSAAAEKMTSEEKDAANQSFEADLEDG